MTREYIQSMHDAQPFKPFIIRMADGRGIEVRNREFLAVHPAGRTVIVFEPNDRMHILDVRLITELEFRGDSFPQSPSPGGSDSF